ncbi:uncharacterized protein LOC144744361 [Ciona intestinalis]
MNFVSDVRYGKFNLHENKVQVKQHERCYKSITASTVHGNKVYVCSHDQITSYDGNTCEAISTLPYCMQCEHMVVCEAKYSTQPGKGYVPQLFVLGKKSINIQQVRTNQIVRFDSPSDQWIVRQNEVDRFREGSVVISHGRRIFILGGKQCDGISFIACSLVDIYEDDKQSFTRGKDMKVARRNFAAVKLHSRIYCFGGIGLNDTQLSSGEFMNIVDGVWTMLTNNIPLQLGEASACCVGDHIVMYGSSCSGKICSMNTYTEEWKIWSENEENQLLKDKVILFPICP